ncbi:cupin domain-containing protein [Porticoccus sp.]
MSTELNFEGVTRVNWKDVEPVELLPGITERKIWTGENGSWAAVYEFAPGAKFPGIDLHASGPEQIYVISGIFGGGREDYREGDFVHQPKNTSHMPQSETGCTLLVIYPEG